PDQTRPAEQSSAKQTVGGSKVVGRQAVRSSVRPDPHPKQRPPQQQVVTAWLRISTPTTWRETATAESWCHCGHHHTATGKPDVLRLIDAHNAHREQCPFSNPEGRTAA
ncbi:MAG: hypothetical protein JO362_01530, partial [Streptomycetaceae bacterium]|nr:hypothetical protein [Streptomycetaceae bacterium]